MQVANVLLVFNFIKFVFGCGSYVYHDQTPFCNAAYAIVGIVQDSWESADESLFQVKVTSNMKGQVTSTGGVITVSGRGRMHSCGPTRMTRNKAYIIYLSIDEDSSYKLKITEKEDFRLTTMDRIWNYDCSCQIEINLPRQSIPNSGIPARDKCVITERELGCPFQNGYCTRRNSRNVCQWVPGVNDC
ncbi:uncharacterized protein LOC133195455 [Saccostrea echinata]|uniref:uncharacterized protein LOC133195455 n=1 Tax=Saccostrea echinata TaxID=191078 RepID=UPI002A8127C5|nr:uncharacterized protein LOC133195455 [Saccostrea echinata]